MPPITNRDLLDFAMDAAWKAGQFTLAHFQTGVEVEWKQDQSPVTAADQGAERLIRELIARRFPGHAVLGEEFGEADKDCRIAGSSTPSTAPNRSSEGFLSMGC